MCLNDEWIGTSYEIIRHVLSSNGYKRPSHNSDTTTHKPQTRKMQVLVLVLYWWKIQSLFVKVR